MIFQPVSGLHKACPDNLGDWYFTGDYPTDGGHRVVNQAFINFMKEVIKELINKVHYKTKKEESYDSSFFVLYKVVL